MQTLFLAYLLLAGATSAIFVLIGSRGSRVAPAQPMPHFDAGWSWSGSSDALGVIRLHGNVAASLKDVLQRLGPVIYGRQVRIDVSVPSDLTVQLSPPVLSTLLEALISVAIHHAPAERLLLTAWDEDGRIAFRVTCDAPGAGLVLWQPAVDSLTDRIVLNGGTLDLDVQPTATILTLILAGVEHVSLG